MSDRVEAVCLALREWAQNEEMIDDRFTEHGRLCLEAADILAWLVSKPRPSSGGKGEG